MSKQDFERLTENICGQGKVQDMLVRIARRPVLPQSFLFAGPRHLGKALLAREFALRVVGTPALSNGFHPDILLIDAQTDDEESEHITIDQVKKAQYFLSRFPEEGRYRVVLIDGADDLTVSAENALLKILEEPNTSSIIILIAHRPERLLSTVRSRLLPILFSPVDASEIRDFFPEAHAMPDFFFSLGLPGIVAEALRSPERFEDMKRLLKPLFQLTRLTWSERIALAEKLSSDRRRLEDILDIWLVGLARRRGDSIKTKGEVDFLEAVLVISEHINDKEGNPRLLMEKLFALV